MLNNTKNTKNNTNPGVKIKLYTESGLFFRSETRMIIGKEKRLIHIAEMKLLRRVKENRLRNRKRNKDIRYSN